MKNKTNKSGCAMSRIKCSAINKDKQCKSLVVIFIAVTFSMALLMLLQDELLKMKTAK